MFQAQNSRKVLFKFWNNHAMYSYYDVSQKSVKLLPLSKIMARFQNIVKTYKLCGKKSFDNAQNLQFYCVTQKKGEHAIDSFDAGVK